MIKSIKGYWNKEGIVLSVDAEKDMSIKEKSGILNPEDYVLVQ